MSSTLPPDLDGLDYVQPLGSGGYADVFLYEQQMPRMKVAVKVLKSEGLTAAINQQFIDEANTMAQLADHPYIVQVFRAGTSQDARPYLVMKYYPPPNLAQRARAARFSVEEVLRTGIQLASAVETAHRAGVIHRDIKPANVLVSQYGSPGLTDFGIAGRGGALDEDDDVGVSVPWAPPEVLFGHSNGDARADVYSLGATLWHLLVGHSPFEVPSGDNSVDAMLPRIRTMPPSTTGRADVPPSLERLLAQAMSKNPLARPGSALEFARSLQQIEQDQRFSRTAIVVLDEDGHVGDSGGSPAGGVPPGGSDPYRQPPPPLGQPVIGGQLSGGRTIGGSPPVPIARDVGGGPRGSGPAGQPPPPGGSAPPPGPVSAGPPPPGANILGPPRGSPPPPVPPPGDTPVPGSTGTRPRFLWPIVAGAVGVLVVIAVVGVALATNRGGDPSPGASNGGGSGGRLSGTPTVTIEPKEGQLVYSMDFEDLQSGDQYFIVFAPNRDNFGPATPTAVAKGESTIAQDVRSGDQQCAKVQVRRGDQSTEWSDIVCARGE